MNARELGSCIVCLLSLAGGLASPVALAQARPSTDPALGRLIERLTDRRNDDLVPAKRPDGSLSLDLKGRFQQAPLARFIDGDLPLVQCVSSVEEADVFFGRNLRSGAPLSGKAQQQHEALVEAARRHGMSVSEYQFYGELIEHSASLPQAMATAGSTIIIINNDGAGEGFNSTAAQFLPAPGNDTNANLGEQRLTLFNAAAAVWGAFLDSSVTIEVRAQFDVLSPCTPAGGVLGAAGAVTAARDFTNAGFASTWYHIALANKRAGTDLAPANADVSATFNSSVDTGCLGAGSHYYYGLDNATPPGTINLFVVLLHELGHGLGFSSFTSVSNGVYVDGVNPDIWAHFLYDATLGLTWNQMNNPQRAASAANTNNLYWNGANVRNASGFLSSGRDPASGRVQMYAPNPVESGSSVSHFSTAAFPNLLMEPSITSGLPLDLDLTRQQMRDIGWYRDSANDLVPDGISSVSPSGGSLTVGSPQTITWTNTGGFAGNVSIELSLDGGGSYTEAVATNIANTGSHSWVVPDLPTDQARLRVREHDFLAPLAESAADFAIVSAANTAPTFTPAGAKSRQQGSPAGAAVTVGAVGDAQTPAGSLVVTPIAGGTATGISVGSVSNSNGTVTATLAAGCSATSGTVRFEVSDGDLAGGGDLQVNVIADAAPTLGVYADAEVTIGQSVMLVPDAAPADNGSVDAITAMIAPATFEGSLDADLPSGVVSMDQAAPPDLYTLTVIVTDNCGKTSQRDAIVQVSDGSIFSDSFEFP